MTDEVEGFKHRDAASYNTVADSFDYHTEKYSRYAVHSMMAEFAEPLTNLLDIGCGTGVATFGSVAHLKNGCVATGIDLSDGMLKFAEQKARSLGMEQSIHFQQGDAEQLPFEDQTFDAVISLYAFRHFPDPVKVAREALRTLKPGGKIVAAVGSAPSLLSLAGMTAALKAPGRKYRLYRNLELIACDQIDALVDTHIPNTTPQEDAEWTHGQHAYTGSLSTILKDAGFSVERMKWAGEQFVVPSADDFWTLQTTFSSKARKRLMNATPQQRDAVKSAFDAQCKIVLERRGHLIYRVGAAIVTATRPS